MCPVVQVVFIIVIQLKCFEWNAVRSYADFCALRKKLAAIVPPGESVQQLRLP